jgi:hypothetical protein
MNTYAVRQFYVVEVLVEAESAEDAKDFAMDYEYTVDTSYLRFAGGPDIEPADIDDDIILIKGESNEM